MVEPVLASVFTHAAVPQKIMLAALAAAIPVTLVALALAIHRKTPDSRWRRLIAELRVAGPALGLLVGALNGFHMGQTILRLPFDPTAGQLAPGLLEVSLLIGLGALVGVVAAGAHLALGWTATGKPNS